MIRDDYLLANPTFNFAPPGIIFAWSRDTEIIHCIRRSRNEGGHLHPNRGLPGFVLDNGPVPAGSSNQSGEGDIRQKRIEADLVDCMVALRGQFNFSNN